MKNDFIDLLKETFENQGAVDIEHIRKLVAMTNTYLSGLESVLLSGDAKTKEEAVATALEIKQFLETKTQNVLSDGPISDEESLMVTEIRQGLTARGPEKSSFKPKKLKPIKMS